MPRPRNNHRDAALAASKTRYFDGSVCLYGHIAERLVAGRKCVVCNNVVVKHRYATNEQYRTAQRQAGKRHYDRVGTAWYHQNQEQASAHNKAGRLQYRNQFKAYTTAWRCRNLQKLTKNAAAYRAAKLQTTPLWADHNAIQEWYSKAAALTRKTGVPHAVNHIVPLNGKRVCGLHVHNNLQVLTRSEHSRKGNRT